MIVTPSKKPQVPDPETLMRRVKDGQWEALRDLYQRYSGGVYHLAWRRLNDSRTAEDVVQDVFLRIWYHAGKWDASRGSVDTWILTITRNVVYDYLRSQHRRRDLSVGDEAIASIVDPEDNITALIDFEALNQMLDGLSLEQRQVVRMVYAEGMSTVRVAEHLNIPVGTVKSRLRLALLHLRRQLEMEAHSDGTL